MTAVIIFIVIGTIAILSAAFMLITPNAVHSAMFLVLNFVCVAFFFLTLGAPFIALVQIAVYAGAIMVLFLFVIMMLGAERVAPDPGPYRWLPRVALALAIIFLITAGSALASGEVNLRGAPPAAPQVRVIHAADTTVPVDFRFNLDQFVMQDISFRAVTDYVELPEGEYGVAVYPAGADPATESAAILGDLALSAGDVVTLVALGSDGEGFTLARLQDNLAPAERDQVRVTLLNGLPDEGPVDLVDPGLALVEDDSRVLIENAAFGETVETILLDPDATRVLDILPAGELGGDPVATYGSLELESANNYVLILAPEQLADGSSRIVTLEIATEVLPLYGSPQQVGYTLFTDYLLPFELVAVLLLAAMVGAIVLTHREIAQESRPRRPIVRRPLVGPQASSALASSADSDDVGQLLKPDSTTGD
jgi:NADH:ubiquinone oxidoreductase subunit 6 (subunit J)